MALVKVAEAAELSPGQCRVVSVGSRELALFNVGGEFYCLNNECPHQDGPLGEGDLEEDVVICPWHAWQVNVRTGEVLYMPGLCVRTHPCLVEDGAVFVEI
ncbi:MAG TPA: Rieske 2Fe-2S domain-containing protein [Chthonomonadaceae bacterium]|nr:Rieske 2Fe-2S domain-containing protein [Chthonomonadaceae bacterium]